ncbi:MAG TPA: hypothetical protein VJZ77_08680 [Blastocatellia bacterium]|nr:hypothetical protein [Blastocatellia bacterium]
MKLRKPVVSLIICLAAVSLIGSSSLADTVKLRDGSVLKGKVVSYTQRKFTIEVYIGGAISQHVVPVEEVESVEFDQSGQGAISRAEPSRAEPTGASQPTEAPPRSGIPRDPAPEVATPEPGPPPGADNGGSLAVIAEKTVSVAAAADWTSTEIRLQRGQRIVITATGEVDLGDSQRTGPDGISLTDSRKLVAARPTGSLIAVIGDDNDDFIFVGSAIAFVAPHNGILFLSVNEGNLKDNTGAFVARVKVLSGR